MTCDYDIFISYSHSDKEFAKKIIYDLQSIGKKVWIDEKNIELGDLITEKIRQGIDNSQFVAVVLSEKSIKSEWVKREVAIATDKEINSKEKVVLPLIVEKCDIPWFLAGKLYADFSNNYEEGIDKLIRVICGPNSAIGKSIKTSVFIDLFDPTGKTSKITKTKKIKVLLGARETIYDCFNVQGSIENVDSHPKTEIMKDRCGVVSLYKFALDKIAREGDVVNFKSIYTVKNTFLSANEYWTIFSPSESCKNCISGSTIPADYLVLSVMFPKERPFIRYNCISRKGNNVAEIHVNRKETSRDGRKLIEWKVPQFGSHRESEYTLSWEW